MVSWQKRRTGSGGSELPELRHTECPAACELWVTLPYNITFVVQGGRSGERVSNFYPGTGQTSTVPLGCDLDFFFIV